MLFAEEIKNGNEIEFCEKVTEISSRLGISPDWLMAVMYFESGLNHRAVNRSSGAVGLIQFMPSTLSNMGSTSSYIQNITNVEQLDFVYKYLLPYKGKMQSLIDVYFAVFFPAAIGKGDDYVLETNKITAETIAALNKIFDTNKDKKITKGEVRTYFTNWVARKLNGSKLGGRGSFLAFGFILLCGLLIYSYNK